MDLYLEVNKQKIRYRKFGSGPNLLLLHTLRTQSEYFDQAIPELSKHFTVYSPDLPGHGESSKDASVTYNEQYFSHSISEFITQLDLKELTIAGESIGASIALSVAGNTKDRVCRVYAFNAYDEGSIIGGRLGKIVSFVGQYSTKVTSEESVGILKKVFEGGVFNKKGLPLDFIKLMVETGKKHQHFPKVIKSVLKNYRSWGKDRIWRYTTIRADLPVHLIYGQHDWSSQAIREENLRLIPNVVQSLTLNDIGHFSFLENPKRNVDIMLSTQN